MNESYHNTNAEEGNTLTESNRKASKQEDAILEFFKRNPGKAYSPEDIYSELITLQNSPLTSIRRAITNLTTQMKLQKTDEQRTGSFGKKIFCWKYRENVEGDLSYLLRS